MFLNTQIKKRLAVEKYEYRMRWSSIIWGRKKMSTPPPEEDGQIVKKKQHKFSRKDAVGVEDHSSYPEI